MSDDIKGAVGTLRKALKDDPDYRCVWQANIAMAVYDACHWAGIKHPDLHKACNSGADNFLRVLCIDVEEASDEA